MKSRIFSCLRPARRARVIPVLAFLSALTIYAPALRAQGFSVESRTAPSVIGAGTFVSLQGRFSLALPQELHRFSTFSLPTPSGRASGDSYTWKMKEGTFTAGCVNATQLLDDPKTSKQVFAGVRDEMEKLVNARGGKLLSEQSIELDKHPGIEVRFEFFQAVLISRVYAVSSRLYQTVAVVRTDQQVYEAVVVSVLDSFKILTEAEAASRIKAEAAKAEPSPLPQEPVASRAASDLKDAGLHGRVKTVFTESQDLSGTWSVQTRKPNSMEYFNLLGNLTKSEFYDYKGNLMEISVYGYLDGERASDFKHIRHEYNPPPIMISTPPGEAKPKYDPRYTNKYTYQYDDRKRLTEKRSVGNEGKLRARYVFKYSGRQREEFVYSEDGSLNQHYLATLDEHGNEVEKTTFAVRDGSIESKQSYVYEFDSKRNWTKRTTSKWVTKDGRSYSDPEYVYYRTIEYYK